MTRFAMHNPDDIGFDVILCVGQSNMVGVGDPLDVVNFDPSDSRVWQYAGSGSYQGQVIVAVDPLWHEAQGVGVGHAMAFARKYVRTVPANRRVLLVPSAHSNTGFNNINDPSGCWLHDHGGTAKDLTKYAVAQANAALALDPGNRLVAILWHQGEADAGILTTTQYQADLDGLIAYLRANITGAANVPFVLGQMLPEGIIATPARAGINTVHVGAQSRLTRTGFWYGPTGYVKTSDGLTTHYNAAGQRLNGPLAYAALLRARVNVTGTAPLAPASVTVTQVGTTAVITWPQPLCRFTDFTVETQVNGGAWTAITHAASPDATATLTGLSAGNVVSARVSTVNETGTSAPTVSAPVTMLAIPAQVTGLTAGTATGSQQPLSWAAVANAATYLVEYKAHTSGTWLTLATVTGLTTTATGLQVSTSYDYRVSATNAAGTGTPSTTLTASTTALTPLLNDIGVTAFYALSASRKLRTAYAGSCIRVRRASDSTTLDVGFDANGNLDTTSMETFCAGTDGFVNIFYDQSGNARDFTIATASAQPQIVAAGATKLLNNKAFANFNGTSHGGSDTTVGLYTAGAASGMFVARAAGTQAAFAHIVGESGASGNTVYALAGVNSTGTAAVLAEIRDDAGAVMVAELAGSLATNPHAVCCVDTGSNMSTFIDGVAGQAGNYTRAGHTVTPTKRSIGVQATFFFAGDLAEMVAFTSALNSTQRATGQANQKSYYGTP